MRQVAVHNGKEVKEMSIEVVETEHGEQLTRLRKLSWALSEVGGPPMLHSHETPE